MNKNGVEQEGENNIRRNIRVKKFHIEKVNTLYTVPSIPNVKSTISPYYLLRTKDSLFSAQEPVRTPQ